jgi:glycosyltransferase involved in cell wall biosynthesis
MSELKKPKISVLMTVYNGEKWLRDSVESILRQSIKDFEFIIVNDGSKDRSEKIIKEFAEKDGRIVYLYKENSGLSDSLNYGLNFARGEWVARLDADDISYCNRLEKLLRISNKNKKFVLIGSAMNLIDRDGDLLKKYAAPAICNKALVKRLSRGQSFFSHSSAFIKTDILMAIGGYRDRLKNACDTDLWLRLSEIGELCCVDEPLVAIRIHSQQMTNNDSGREQLTEAVMARISYLLRDQGYVDPISGEADEKSFENFKEYVRNFLSGKKIFLVYDIVKIIKSIDFARLNFASRFIFLIKNFYFLSLYFLWKYHGENYSEKAMKKWINFSSNS